jgi:hypothetical protein
MFNKGLDFILMTTIPIIRPIWQVFKQKDCIYGKNRPYDKYHRYNPNRASAEREIINNVFSRPQF